MAKCLTSAGNLTAFSFCLRLHYKAAVAAGVSTKYNEERYMIEALYGIEFASIINDGGYGVVVL